MINPVQKGYARRLLQEFLDFPTSLAKNEKNHNGAKGWSNALSRLADWLFTFGLAERIRKMKPIKSDSYYQSGNWTIADYAAHSLGLAVDKADGDEVYQKVERKLSSATEDARKQATERIVKHDSEVPELLVDMLTTDNATLEGFKANMARLVEELLQPLDEVSFPTNSPDKIGMAKGTGPEPTKTSYQTTEPILPASADLSQERDPPPAAPVVKAKRKRMTVKEANAEAMKLAHKQRAGFFALSERQQANRIGCSWTTWKKTEFYLKAQEKRPSGKVKKVSSPKTVSLTPPLEVMAGEGDKNEVLNNLIADQEADKEPSPLEKSRRKVHFGKKL